jgi:pre-mRNA-splicing factor 18
VRFFIKRGLVMWNRNLRQRGVEERQSIYGKKATGVYKETHMFVAPLLGQLKKSTVPKEIVEGLVSIVTHCVLHAWTKMNEAYLKLSIGEAAWPMGVARVGIHARAGRERISTGQTGHVLNSEGQRKYIQSVKRITSKYREWVETENV